MNEKRKTETKESGDKWLNVKYADLEASLYDRWRVKIKLRDKLYGGVPKRTEIISAWLMEKIKKAIKAGHEIKPELTDEELGKIIGQVDVSEEKTWNGFFTSYQGKEIGPWMPGYNIKACLREAAFSLGYTTNLKVGKKGFRQHFQHGLHVKPDVIHLGEIAGEEELVGHVTGAQGPQSIVRRSDYVFQPEIEFEIWSIACGMLNDEHIVKMMATAQENGLGAMRSREVGKFDVIEIERIGKGKI